MALAGRLDRSCHVPAGAPMERPSWLAVFPLSGRPGGRIAAALVGALQYLGRRSLVRAALAMGADGNVAAGRAPSRTGGPARLDAGDAGIHSGIAVCGYRHLVIDPDFVPLGGAWIFDAVPVARQLDGRPDTPCGVVDPIWFEGRRGVARGSGLIDDRRGRFRCVAGAERIFCAR